MDDLRANAELKIRNYANFGSVEILTFYARKSKHIMDKIDVLLSNCTAPANVLVDLLISKSTLKTFSIYTSNKIGRTKPPKLFSQAINLSLNSR